jgi:hypothetical protein
MSLLTHAKISHSRRNPSAGRHEIELDIWILPSRSKEVKAVQKLRRAVYELPMHGIKEANGRDCSSGRRFALNNSRNWSSPAGSRL